MYTKPSPRRNTHLLTSFITSPVSTIFGVHHIRARGFTQNLSTRPRYTCTTTVRRRAHRKHKFRMLSTTPPKVLFSDIDGTLVHYADEITAYGSIEPTEGDGEAVVKYKTGEIRTLRMLPSSTAGMGYISCRTLELVARIREAGIIFVLITGARASTYDKRRPVLPDADYEFYESGGRLLADGKVVPEWTSQPGMLKAIGRVPDEINPELPPPHERSGTLWELYRQMEGDGWKIDARAYATQFRVQVDGVEKEDSFLKEIVPNLKQMEFQSSYNLGKADIYPIDSGKANAAMYIMKKHAIEPAYAVAMFDDDNDIQLGRLCGTAFVPGVTHPNVQAELAKNKNWHLTKHRGFLGTEEALQAILEMAIGAKDNSQLAHQAQAVPT